MLKDKSCTRNLKLCFVGYCKENKGYRLLDEKTSKVIIRRDVTFNEKDFGYTEAVKSKETVEIDMDLEKADEPGQRHDEHHHSEWQRQHPVRYSRDEYADTASTDNRVDHIVYNECQILYPKTMEEAMTVIMPRNGN